MRERIRCIGGPLDKEFVDYIGAVRRARRSERFDFTKPLESMPTTEVETFDTYRIVPMNRNGFGHHFYVHESISETDALNTADRRHWI